ncbi:MAG: hypothetical protein H6699_10450, partial [Myxococcales bacterium]|nr:hypothetical protein [Myxococcales bacterium]
TTDTCQAGTCVQAAATDCSTCGDGSQQCMNGYCGGADFESYDAEGGSMPAVFVASGTSAWTVQSTTKHAGTYAFQSGTITHSQNTGMTRTVTLDAAGAVTFWYSTSSESGWDKLRFFVDGVERFNDSGTKAWTFRSEALTAGTHTLLWQYTKDSGGSSGTDQVWVDDILITETVAACTADACGDKLWTGSACIACLDVSVGSACTGANPCMSYTCQETTGCTGVAVADGITCDSSATDCQSQTCQSGSCTSANVAECTACVNGGAGTCSATGTCNVPATGNIFSNGAESNALPSGWTTGAGNLAWTVSTAQVHAGTYSFKAGGFNVGNAVSDLSGTVTTTSSAMLSFWFKVETERYWDNFQLVVDGISVVRPNYAGSSTAGLNGWSSNVSGVAEPWQRIAVPLSAGTHTITFRYVKDGSGNGGTTCADTVWVDDISIDPVNATTYDFESGSIPGAFGSTGTLPWGVSTGNLPSGTGAYPTRVGTYAAKAGAITHSQSTGLTYALVTATDGAIMFDWRVIASTSSVSSWTGTTGDTLRFYLDGVLQTGWANSSTSSPWIRSAFFVPAGSHTFEWQFTKDSSTTATSESAWVDNITIAPLGGCP